MAKQCLESDVISAVEGMGCKCRIVPMTHVRDLSGEFEGLRHRGEFDDGFYKYLNKYLSYDAGGIPETGSIIVASVRQPIVDVSFSMGNHDFKACVPPTYNFHSDDGVIEAVKDVLGPHGLKVVRSSLPKKALAAHSGLAEYGRNNIAYVEGFGSFHRLIALYTDLPSTDGRWDGPRMAEACNGCEICMRACPTNAISQDRFLLHAERCLTYFNEDESDMPAWIDVSWHNSLLGCMMCQLPCPMNSEHIGNREEISFDGDETQRILKGSGELGADTVKKLDRLGLKDDLQLISRNLGLLLNSNK